MARENESASADTTDKSVADGSKLFGAPVKAGVSPDEAYAASQEVLVMAGRNMIVPLPSQIDSLKMETSTQINILKIETSTRLDALRVETSTRLDSHEKQLAILRWMLIAILSLVSAATALAVYKTFFDAPRTVAVAAPDAASASEPVPDERTSAKPSSDTHTGPGS